jgi:hypothetical protein
MSDNVVLIIVIAQSITLYQIACSVYLIVIANMYINVSVCFPSVYYCNCTMYMIGYSHMLFRYETIRKGAPHAEKRSNLPPPSPRQLTRKVKKVVRRVQHYSEHHEGSSNEHAVQHEGQTKQRVSKLLNLHFLVPFLPCCCKSVVRCNLYLCLL